MNAFESQGATASKVAGVLFTTVKQGVTTIPQLASAMGQVNAIAANSGVKLEEVGASMAVLTKNGLRSTQAATALKAGITAFSKPTSEAQKIIKKLGIDFSTTAIKSKGFATVMREVREATGGNVETLQKLFSNVRARTSLIPLLTTKWKEFNKQLDNFKDTSGAANAAFKRITETSGFQLDRLNVSFTNLSAAVTSILDKELASYFKEMADSAGRGGAVFTVFLRSAQLLVQGLILLEQSILGVKGAFDLYYLAKAKVYNLTGQLPKLEKEAQAAYDKTAKRLDFLYRLQGKVGKRFDEFISGENIDGDGAANALKKYNEQLKQAANTPIEPPKPEGETPEQRAKRLKKEADAIEAAKKKEAKAIADALAAQVKAQKEAMGEIKNLYSSAFGDYQAFQIAEATVATYSAANKALAAFPPPKSFIAAAAAIAAGIANIAKIRAASSEASQSTEGFQQGGIVPGNQFEGDRILARVNSGEMILNRRQQGQLFDSINSGKGGSSSITINVQSVTGDIPQRSLDNMIDQIRERVVYGNKRFV